MNGKGKYIFNYVLCGIKICYEWIIVGAFLNTNPMGLE